MRKVLVFGGTLDGRLLAEKLVKNDIFVHLCVATDGGSEVFKLRDKNIFVQVGRLNSEQISELICKNNFDIVVDATHPYATEITANIKKASENIRYLRLLREKSEFKHGVLVETIEKACEICKNDNILLTTGSKEISRYKSLFDKNVYARVLPTAESVNLCKSAGLRDEQIITHFGVCTYEENVEIIRKYKICTLITKDGGKTGGFYEKYRACVDENVELIVIKRPNEEKGYTSEEIIDLILEK